jgi:RNA recognition motif-containing protein
MAVAKIFVASLNFDTVDDSALFQLFSQYIDVFSAKIVRDFDGQSKGFGFVAINDMDVERALELDGYLFHNRRIRVQVARGNDEWARRRLTTS